jgi:two-component system LytT family response regulator
MIRVIVVDDEHYARRGIRDLLQLEPDVEVVAECDTGRDAVKTIRELQPDLVLLDIEMPEGTGFQVLEALPVDQMPVVIFVTAHDRHALEAFEAHAIDYLLKPVERGRMHRAMERARAAIHYRQGGDWARKLQSLLDEVKSPPRYRQRLMIRGSGRQYLLATNDIDWIEASGNYARLHVGREHHLLRETMANLETELDPACFCRIHRSTIVNLERVQEMQPWTRGDQIVILKDGTRLTLSAHYRPGVEQRLGRPR